MSIRPRCDSTVSTNSFTSASRDTSHRTAVPSISWATADALLRAVLPARARFNHLLARMPGMRDPVLTERFRELETEGIVERLVDPGPPVEVSYRLSSRGRVLEPVLAAVSMWAERWLTTAA